MILVQQCQIPGSFGSTIASDGCVMKQQHTNLKLQICTLQHLIVMKEKIKPNQKDDFHIEKMRQKSTSFIYIS